MTWLDLINRTLTVYDEYHPQQAIDEDLKTMVDSFLKKHINDYHCILPTSAINDAFKVTTSSAVTNGFNIQSINYKGGSIVLSSLNAAAPFLKLISFKHKEWTTKLFYVDLIDENSPKRKLQDDRWTAGKISKPVICLENVAGQRCLCFWGYETKLNDVEEFTYIKRVDNEVEFLQNEDYILEAYIYYALYFVCNTTQEAQISQLMISQMQQLLSIHNIEALLPISFNTSESKKK